MQELILRKENQDFRITEAFKMLRTNIEFSGEDVKVIAFTSTTPNEGKSTVTYNLAQTFAEAGKKVLLIDADLRKSVMKQRVKKGKTRYGLTHYLTGMKTLDEVLCKTDVGNLYLCMSGPVPPNPSELLSGKRFASMIEAARKVFDFIIVDTPPIGSVIDASIAAQPCDGVVMVVRSGMTSYRFVRKARASLEMAHCKILGYVLNGIDISKKSSYHGKYYGHYYGDENAEKLETTKEGKSSSKESAS